MIEAGRVVSLPRPSRIRASFEARLGPAEIDGDTVEEMLTRYGLRQRRSSKNLRLARRSHNVVVETDRGRVVLKLYRPQWTPEAVTSVHSILDRLAALDVPAPRVVRTEDGQTWVPTSRGSIGAAFGWIDGRNLSIRYLRRADRLRLTSMAGETLAGLHSSLRGFEPAGAHHMGFVSLQGTRRRDAAWHERTVADLIERSEGLVGDEGAATALLIREAPSLLERLMRLDHGLDAAALERTVIHGDFGLHNLLFRARGPAVPVDFELSRLDWRVNDLISVTGKHRYADGRYDLEAMTTLLRAYASTDPLTNVERERFADAWRLAKLQAAVQYWRSFFDTAGPIRKLRSALDALEQASWPDREPGAVRDLVKAASTEAPRGVGVP